MYTKAFGKDDLSLLSFGAPASIQERVKVALDQGLKVEWVYSSFTDPGGDYCAVAIEGAQVYRQEGY